MQKLTKIQSSDLKTASRVISQEIEGLESIKTILNENFCQVIDILLQTKGRVIITGVGKSGLIAKKFAATLSSMGTPSMFIHPMEALHGDLGMITENDIVILFSNSGQSHELNQICQYCQRFNIHTIVISRNLESDLVRLSDFNIVMPNIAEATKLPAPTTSTTMMLAISDVIAVVLAERKGFTHSDFKVFHPGGSIGAQLIKISDLMHRGIDMPLVNDSATMIDVILEITKKRMGCAGVIDPRGNLIGLITDYDLRIHINNDYHTTLALKIMNKNPTTLGPDLFAAQVLYVMNSKKITNCFITEGNRPVGVIHVHDLLKAGVA